MVMFIKGKVTLFGGSISENLQSVIEDGVDELSGAIFEEMSVILEKSQEIVPVGGTGNLQASGMAVGVNVVSDGQGGGSVVIGYGGTASAYSLIQHQTPPPGEGVVDSEGKTGLEFSHRAGRTWKYLENPVLEAAEGMERRIGERVRRRMAAR